MWGLRPGEAIGRRLLNLDTGLPVEALRPLVRRTLTGVLPDAPVRIEAVNRRGRPVTVRVTTAPLAPADAAPNGVIILVDEETAPAR